jgi:hypothetical protein
LRPSPDPESDDAEVLDFKYSSNHEPTLGEEHSTEDSYERDEWQGTPEGEHREKSLHNPNRGAASNGAIGSGFQ